MADINRILKPHGVRLVLKKSKEWGESCNVTVQEAPVVVRSRAPAAVKTKTQPDPVPSPVKVGDDPKELLPRTEAWPFPTNGALGMPV